MKVLIVDDVQMARSIIRRALNESGIDVIEAVDGNSALKLYSEEIPDVVCLDIDLPGGMDGLEVLKQLKQTDQDVKIIMVSAMSSQYNFVESFKLGAKNFLVKPVDLIKLVEVVQELGRIT